MPSWKDLNKFLINDNWIYEPRKSGTDKHYKKRLSNGSILVTRVSRGTGEISSGLFSKILKSMECSKSYFNKVLANRRKSTDDPVKRI